MSDLVDSIARGNPGSVKTVLATVVLALASYQVLLAAIGYRRVRIMAARPALLTHRASGDTIVVLVAVVALLCAGAYGLDGDAAVHEAAGFALAAVLAIKILTVRGVLPLGGLLPYLGSAVFALLALTCFTSSWFDS